MPSRFNREGLFQNMKIHSRDIFYSAHKAVFVIDKIADKILQDNLNLTYSQFRILAAIKRNPDVSQKDIADYLDMTEAAVSRQIEFVVKREFVKKTENKKNRRQSVLALTSLGINQLQKAFKTLDAKFEEVFGVINPKEREVLSTAFSKLLKVVCKDCRCY